MKKLTINGVVQAACFDNAYDHKNYFADRRLLLLPTASHVACLKKSVHGLATTAMSKSVPKHTRQLLSSEEYECGSIPSTEHVLRSSFISNSSMRTSAVASRHCGKRSDSCSRCVVRSTNKNCVEGSAVASPFRMGLEAKRRQENRSLRSPEWIGQRHTSLHDSIHLRRSRL